MNPGELVTARTDHPANVVFEIMGRTKNGWLECRAHSEQNGKLLIGGHIFKFRVSDMRPWPLQPEEVASVMVSKLPIGTRFHDYYGKQVFEMIGVCTVVKTRRMKWVLKCLESPFTKERPTGEISRAFFCMVGEVVYRERHLRVFPIEEAKAA